MYKDIINQKISLKVEMDNNFKEKKYYVLEGKDNETKESVTMKIDDIDIGKGYVSCGEYQVLLEKQKDVFNIVKNRLENANFSENITNPEMMKNIIVNAIDTNEKTILYTNKDKDDRTLYASRYLDNEDFKKHADYLEIHLSGADGNKNGNTTVRKITHGVTYYDSSDKRMELLDTDDDIWRHVVSFENELESMDFCEIYRVEHTFKNDKCNLEIWFKNDDKIYVSNHEIPIKELRRDLPLDRIDFNFDVIKKDKDVINKYFEIVNKYSYEKDDNYDDYARNMILYSTKINEPERYAKVESYRNLKIENGLVQVTSPKNKKEEFAPNCLVEKDNQLYIKKDNKEIIITSLDSKFVEKEKIKSLDDVFYAFDKIENKYARNTVYNYDIVEEGVYNSNKKKFETKYYLTGEMITDDILNPRKKIEFPLNEKTTVYFKHHYLQQDDKVFILDTPYDYDKIKNIVITDEKCSVKGATVEIDGKKHKPELVNTKEGFAICKDKDGVPKVYAVSKDRVEVLGEDPAKPVKDEVIFVNRKNNDLKSQKFKDMDLLAKESDKLEHWDIKKMKNDIVICGEKNGEINFKAKVHKIFEKTIVENIDGKEVERYVACASIRNSDSIIELGKPSNKVGDHSIFKESIENMIDKTNFTKFCTYANNEINREAVATKEDVESRPYSVLENIPKKCFVIMDDEIYLKVGNKLHNNEKSLNYDNEISKIDYAFTTNSMNFKKVFEVMSDKPSIEFEGGKISLHSKDEYGNNKTVEVYPTLEFGEKLYYSNRKKIYNEFDKQTSYNEPRIMDRLPGKPKVNLKDIEEPNLEM